MTIATLLSVSAAMYVEPLLTCENPACRSTCVQPHEVRCPLCGHPTPEVLE
ncbi:MAG TPA: hypothetical protein VNB29_09200 [Chthoniobacterales bacterium]|nr:hypothetical protein [Chthoniobacterales bacterium]